MKTVKIVFVFLLFFAFMTIADDALAQCPMCKAQVESGLKDGKTTVGLGLNDGILYLLAAPYVLMGFIGFSWYKSRKKKYTEEA